VYCILFLLSMRGTGNFLALSLDAPSEVTRTHLKQKHLVEYDITGGIQNPRWDTRSPVGYEMPGGIQNARWDTKRPVGYKNPGGIWGSSKKNLVVYKNSGGIWGSSKKPVPYENSGGKATSYRLG
jgi:hypothetical protein